MQLRSLEIHGFKSFPEKTTLRFDKPVTVIVGPNGSGKSNISDAILWVMGEQSTKSLRGAKMEDVIFGGTQSRAQVGFAEVSLILDNEDGALPSEFSEIMLTRRYYRSGESEYFLNRNLARLRDINELLMDTGLGREGYSIIGQGKIDEILSAKSTDRRSVFEEAVGISRYRHRKEETERKLRQTQENVVRINDKLAELKLTLDPLEEQAETAKRYIVLRDELRGYELSLWTHNLETLAGQIEKNTADLAAAAGNIEKLKAELESAYKASENFSEKTHELEMTDGDLRLKLAAAENEIGAAASSVLVLKSDLEHNLSQIERIESELSETLSRGGGITEHIESRKQRVDEIDAGIETLSSEIDKLNATLEAVFGSDGRAGEELADLVASESACSAAIADCRERITALAGVAQELYDREESGSRMAAETADKLIDTRAGAEASAKRLLMSREEAVTKQNQIAAYELIYRNFEKKHSTLEDKNNTLSLELGAVRNRISLLTEMEKEYQGYSKAVRLVMTDSGRGILKNIHGTVADLLKTGDKYSLAIETALGGAMQSIITETGEDAKTAIEMLKRRDGGRATFLPISSIRGRVLDTSEIEREEGYEGLALHLITFDARFSEIYADLLGRTVIASDLTAAMRLSKKFGARFRLVTLDGQVINAGGSMTGGSVSRNSGIISRTNELSRLTRQQADLTEQLRVSERETAEAKRELTKTQTEMAPLSAELRELQDGILRLETEEEHFALLIAAAEESIAAQKQDSDALSLKIKENTVSTESLREKAAELSAQLESLQKEIGDKTRGREELSAKREAINTQVSQKRAESAALVAELQAVKNAISELESMNKDVSGDLLKKSTAKEELIKQNELLAEEIGKKETANSALYAQKDEITRQLEQNTAKKMELEAARGAGEKEMRERNETLLNYERELSRLQQRKLSCEMDEKQIIDKLWDNYELSRSAAFAERTQLTNTAETTRQIASLKSAIAKLGTPNLGAIEEFERLSERHNYLKEQLDDVQKAKDDLLGVMDDLTGEMEVIFRREFELIKVSFNETFTELFGGGKAELILEDPEDVLNCGIEIKAQPPGKALKTLTLLSGGERAFIAIALYFAILKTRPAPFVVMDEIEAALDDANVIRFAEYLRRMSERSQMIVISHRRGTMEEADVLYGVTMQESGVSRILSIDISEAERHIAMNKA